MLLRCLRCSGAAGSPSCSPRNARCLRHTKPKHNANPTARHTTPQHQQHHNTYTPTTPQHQQQNFYAPWCHWCQRLEPAWEAATKAVHEKYPEGGDGRIRFAKVDCTAEAELCRAHFITGFPSIRVFRRGHDDIYIQVGGARAWGGADGD